MLFQHSQRGKRRGERSWCRGNRKNTTSIEKKKSCRRKRKRREREEELERERKREKKKEEKRERKREREEKVEKRERENCANDFFARSFIRFLAVAFDTL